MENKVYIAYGSNLNLSQMARRCPGATVMGTSEIQDYELLFSGNEIGFFGTVEPCVGKYVPVLLWSITPEHERALDEYEKYPEFYHKVDMELRLQGEAVKAFLYIVAPGHWLGLPGEKYYNAIAQGYESAGFDLAILQQAVQATKEKMKRQ